MRTKWTVLLWMLMISGLLAAQNTANTSFQVKGILLDSLTQEGEPYATIKIVKKEAPAKALKMLVTDMKGQFQEKVPGTGNFVMTITSVGRTPIVKDFSVKAGEKLVDFGTLYIVDASNELGQVEIVAQKPLVKADIDKIEYNVQDDPDAQSNSVLEMLRKVPMVTVDGDDQIQLKGSTNFKIYMNGKPSNLLSNNPAEVLKSMPANSVKNIEEITDPGAKYDAEGIGGIINIITTKNALQGYTGTVRVNGSSLGRVGGGGYISLKAGKFGLTANYNYNYNREPWNESTSIREDLENDEQHFLTQNGRRKNNGPFQFGSLEGSYEIDSLNLLTVGANLFHGKMTNRSEYTVNMQDINRNPVYDYNRNSDATETFGSTDVSVDYQHSTHKKDELLTISYRFSHSPNDNKDYTELKNVVNYNPWLGYPQNNINKASTNEHTGQVDYTTPTWKDQTLEVGAKYIFRQSRSNTDRTAFNDSLNIWEDITSKDSHFRHTQHIYSAYLGYSMKFDKFGVKAGVRAEGTALDVKYEMAPDMNFDTHYFDVVPNATVSYQLNMAQQLRLGYNMRIQRPGIWYLNPYVNNADPQNISFGNPNLDSEKSNNINLNYSMFAQKFSINASATYTFVNNSIERYTFIDPENPGIFQTTYGNIGKKQSTGLFVYANWNPVPLFRIYMNGGMDYTDLKSEKNDMANSGFSGRIFAGTQFNFPLDFRMNIQGGYFSPWIQLQGKGSPFYFTGISVNKDFLKKKLSVQLSFQNPFWKRMKMESTTSDDTFFRRDINYRTMRMLMVSVSYRFGTLKDAIKKVKRGISNDDMKSGGSGGGEQQM